MRISTRHVLSDISIHALRVEGDWCAQWNDVCEYISIHALRVEGDYMLTGTDDTAENFYPRPPGGGRQHAPPSNVLTNCISIHALRVEGDNYLPCFITSFISFLSTPSGWRATAFQACSGCQAYDFYPRPPGGGRLYRDVSHVMEQLISIHALRVEGDLPSPISFIPLDRFLSTPSGWRATSSTSSCLCVLLISIHALRVEGD